MKKSQEEAKPVTFGEFFRQRRISLGFTLRSFCKTYQLDPGNVSRLERNIIPPTVDEEKLAGYATALKITKGSPDWITFFDLAHTAKGRIPKDILLISDFLPELLSIQIPSPKPSINNAPKSVEL